MIARLLILLLLVLGGPVAVLAQQSPESQRFKQRLRSQYLTDDTAQAIITLYSRRQFGGGSWIFSSALAAARLIAEGGSTTSVNGVVVAREPAPVGAALLVAAPFAAYGASKLVRFSNGKLDQVLASYAAGQPLPRRLRRKLKRRFFAQPIIPYKPAN